MARSKFLGSRRMVFTQRKAKGPFLLALLFVAVAVIFFVGGVYSAQQWPDIFGLPTLIK